MKMKAACLNHMLVVAILLLLAPVAIFAQEGYFGATNSIARAEETSLPVLAARSDIYSGGGDGYYGAQQPSDTCAPSQQVTTGKTAHLMLVRGTKIGSATLPLADENEEISTCVVPRKNSLRSVPDPSASHNRVEYGGGGM